MLRFYSESIGLGPLGAGGQISIRQIQNLSKKFVASLYVDVKYFLSSRYQIETCNDYFKSTVCPQATHNHELVDLVLGISFFIFFNIFAVKILKRQAWRSYFLSCSHLHIGKATLHLSKFKASWDRNVLQISPSFLEHIWKCF